MSPIGKIAMEDTISGLSMAYFRMLGGAVCFWLASFLAPREKVSAHDLKLLFFASLLGIVCNQGCFTFGISLTSPINAPIVATTAPIITMIVAAIYLKEPITGKKFTGVVLGSIGALTLILSSSVANSAKEGNIWGDLLCLVSQFCFCLYLILFKEVIARYNIFTLMKWMFTYAAIVFLPFALSDINSIPFAEVEPKIWLSVAYVVFGGTFVAYILMMIGQKALRPTVVSMYNYMQPIAGTAVSIALGMATFGIMKGIAVVLVFVGVYFVTQSKSREQVLAEKAEKK
jgi:drug/metabolite transporter (DMT)-like permease